MSELRQRQPRIRDEAHLKFIRSLPCCIPGCGDNTSTEAAHLRVGSINHDKRDTGGGERPSDRWTLPLCSRCHRDQHAAGDELKFWAEHGINPFFLAMNYYDRHNQGT
jgi:hypothetical protein